jgi:hypothetical protein
MAVRISLSPVLKGIVTFSLTLELLIPILWILLGTILPTIPFVASVFVCCFVITGFLPFMALVTLFTIPKIGVLISIASLSWAWLLAALLVLEELIRVVVTNYPDPVEITVAIVMLGIGVLLLCTLQIAWLIYASIKPILQHTNEPNNQM